MNSEQKQMKRYSILIHLFIMSCWLAFSSCQQAMYPKVSLESADIKQGNEFLQSSAGHIIEGDFNSALIESNKALKQLPYELRQNAIFQKGVIFAHPENKDRDIKRAAFYFRIAGKENENILIQSHAQFVKAILTSLSVQQKINKILENNMITLKKEVKAFKDEKAQWQRNKQSLEKENSGLKNKVAALKQEVRKISEEGVEEIIIQEEILNQ